MLLANSPLGSKFKITGFQRGLARAHLLTMGLTKGTCVEVVGRAPMGGDPVVLRVRDIRLSVRHADAAVLKLQQV
jgi:Fe2+ transport system protein FeoA